MTIVKYFQAENGRMVLQVLWDHYLREINIDNLVTAVETILERITRGADDVDV